ncbi:hypothetical protein CK203_110852 [Vitis vinifera]|uniref:Reverse transcriptase domain-containing protein n=1 Tax=Vitis vinifera TaxID=29760 RepID=A0A438C9L2_VITVI|nr:hypothetical protein CK203_110852 [Vitis vinifera]
MGPVGGSPLETTLKGDLVKEEDRNTGFFHRMASAHRRNNALDRIKVNGEWLVEEQEMNCISWQEAESLEIPFAEIEIYSALMEMSGDKAPGPDGFTVAFWQNAWDFTKEEIMEMFKEFHEHNSFVRSLNNTFLVLQKMGFGTKWVGWMWSCVSSAKFSVLVNGVSAGFFPSTRGLRQGNSLSLISLLWEWKFWTSSSRERWRGDIYQDAPFGVGAGWGPCPLTTWTPLRVPNRATSMWDGMEERSGGDLRFGKDNTFPKGGGSLL